jgi:DNA-binding cell septation regulator SpoVG
MSIFSEVEVTPLDLKNKNMLGRGSFVVSEAVKVNFTYMNGSNGPFVSLPQDRVQKDGETKYYPHAKLINKAAIEELNKLVAAKFEKEKGMGGSRRTDSTKKSEDVDDDLPF